MILAVVTLVVVAFAATLVGGEVRLMSRFNRDLDRPPLRELLRRTAPIRRQERRDYGVRFWPGLLVFLVICVVAYSVVALTHHG